MKTVKCVVKVSEWELDEDAQKRMWTDSDCQYQAEIWEYADDVERHLVKGCPLGRSFVGSASAIQDLKDRVMMESNVELVVEVKA